MATRLVCDYPTRGDICGSLIDAPVEVTIDGVTHDLEICATHSQPIRDLIGKLNEPAVPRRQARKRTAKRAAPAKRSRAKKATSSRRRRASVPAAAAVRAWAVENGVAVPAKGRVPGAVVEQYRQAS